MTQEVQKPRKALVIAMWAGPGVGKSVTAASTFVELKLARISCEWVTEYAKEKMYEGVLHETTQMEIVQEQLRRLDTVSPHVSVIVTDAPLHISQVYAHSHEEEEVAKFIAEHEDRFEFWNVLLHRDLEEFYETAGRWQPVDVAQAFHRDEIAPFVRQLKGERFFELHVSEAPQVLLKAVQEYLALNA